MGEGDRLGDGRRVGGEFSPPFRADGVWVELLGMSPAPGLRREALISAGQSAGFQMMA